MATNESTCSVEGCESPAKARTWCGMHWWRWRFHNDLNYQRPTLKERVWSYIDRRGPDECWPCTGGKRNQFGHRAFETGGRGSPSRGAHSLVYEWENGPVPPGMVIDHLCDNPPCCNPRHLRACTQGENVLRGNSPWAINARKTHCSKCNLPLAGENLYVRPDGSRQCRNCRTIQNRLRYLRKKRDRH